MPLSLRGGPLLSGGTGEKEGEWGGGLLLPSLSHDIAFQTKPVLTSAASQVQQCNAKKEPLELTLDTKAAKLTATVEPNVIDLFRFTDSVLLGGHVGKGHATMTR